MTYTKGERVHYFKRDKQEATFVDAKGTRCRITIEDENGPRTINVPLDCIDKIRADLPHAFTPERGFRSIR